MPLAHGSSRAIIGRNIAEMERNHPRKQAIAAALSTARRYPGRASGGSAPQAPTYQTAAPAVNAQGFVPVPQGGTYNLDLTTGAMQPGSLSALQSLAQRGLPIVGTPSAMPAQVAGMGADTSNLVGQLLSQSEGRDAAKRGGRIGRLAAGGAPSFPMSMATPWWTRRDASEMEQHPAGLISGPTGGRADRVPMSLAPNSHVMPADVTSGWGQGNTLSGAANLEHALSSGPFGAALPKPPLHSGSPRGAMPRMPRMARGGVPEQHGGIKTLVSDGEYIVSPKDVLRIGNGDYKRGHDWLDRLIVDSRKHIVKHMSKLPGPVRE